MSLEEIWRPVDGFPDYQVSSYGNIVHVERPNLIRKTTLNHQGFPNLVLFNKEHPGARYLRQVNKLVATAFLGRPPAKMDAVWHINGDLQDCHADNLKWDMRARVMEWNEMHREGEPKFRTPQVMINETGRIYNNAFEVALAVGDIETAVVGHIERYPPQYADRARYKYVE